MNHIFDYIHNNNLKTILLDFKPIFEDSIKDSELSEKDKEYLFLNLSCDLVKTFEKYILDTDIIEKYKIRSKKGSFIIDSHIIRNNDVYLFETEVITAGGYNIQQLHYRYIVKTNLPKSDIKTYSNIIKKHIQNIAKKEKLENLIKCYEKYISDEKIKCGNLKSEDVNIRIKNHLNKFNINWNNVSSNLNIMKNLEVNNEEEFNIYKQKEINYIISKHDDEIRCSLLRISQLEKELNKLQLL